ncbi:nitroreductase family protein [Chitinolyticbacter meiyuanensis]|uniref:nitroreductase family protein n=1 Tax=Chitinolyticbacter meiyuanensis TaxID=682798 RepID=UPI0011E5AF01|nr:nitroreductase family protein [Chitinolyticbacter meiyuanensis]
MDFATLIEQRASANQFDAAREVADATLTELLRLATLAPSAFNAQNRRFVVARSQEAKQRLLRHANGQDKVVHAAATVIVVGRLAPHATLAAALQPSVDAGLVSTDLQATFVHYATEMYDDQPQIQRDEAIRSASLSAMTLMLAAEDAGLASCPMIGFDAAGVHREFGLGDDEIPVMLVAIGHAAAGNWPQKPRLPLTEVLAWQ